MPVALFAPLRGVPAVGVDQVFKLASNQVGNDSRRKRVKLPTIGKYKRRQKGIGSAN
jgi:hypothetical protein